MFTLYKNDPSDPPRRRVSFDDLDNKAFWCDHGENKEHAFVKVMSKIDSPYQIDIHPKKKSDPYHPDLHVEHKDEQLIGEVKIKNSPLFIAEKYNVSPQYALTMDLKDSFNYNKWLKRGEDITIFAWVKWEAHEMELRNKVYSVKPMRGIWVTTFSKIRALEKSKNPPSIHWYHDRFRHPPEYDPRHITKDSIKQWCNELIEFEPRLLKSNGKISNITSDSFFERDGVTYPTGHSSASYVFDLLNKEIFTNIFIHR